MIPVSHTQDTVGPIARCVKDVAIALTVMASTGVDPADDATSLRPMGALGTDYAANLSTGTLQGLRIGLIKTFFGQTDSGETTPVTNTMYEAVSALHKAGTDVVDITEPEFDSLAILKALDTQRYEYREELSKYLQDPGLLGKHPRSFEELYSSGKFLVIPAQYEYLQTAHTASTASEAYTEVCSGIEQLTALLRAKFDDHNLDALIYPQQASLVMKIGCASQSQRNGILGALTGSPVVTVPIGYSSPMLDAPAGVPIG